MARHQRLRRRARSRRHSRRRQRRLCRRHGQRGVGVRHRRRLRRASAPRAASMPSWIASPRRSRQLPRQCASCRSASLVEVGVTFGWERYADESIGIDRFGASAARRRRHGQAGHQRRRRAAGSEQGVIMDRLAHLYHEFGQSPWLDSLKAWWTSRLANCSVWSTRGIRGLTSNPTIFRRQYRVHPTTTSSSAPLMSASTIDQ